MTTPTFLIIGAGRSGTTSLYHYLRQHPQVFMSPIKETHYFAIEAWRNESPPAPELSAPRWGKAIRTHQAYQRLFAGAQAGQATGEASPTYLRVAGVPEVIRAHLPEVKLIAILRQPAERAFSHYQLLRRNGVEPIDTFADALAAEDKGQTLPDNTLRLYRDGGHYHRQLVRYYDLFPQDQLCVCLYDDLKADATQLMRRIYGFLDVDAKFTPDTSFHHNESAVVKNRSLRRVLERHTRVKQLLERIVPLAWQQQARQVSKVRVSLDPDLRAAMTRDYRPDVLRLQELIGRDLSPWLA